MPHRLLFIPVSTPIGVGEYMRSLILAQSLASQRPDLDIRFALNRHAPYFKDCPFPTFACPDTPTRCNAEVNAAIRDFRPHVVVFDASGRVAQLRTAATLGAHTIMICQHVKKRQKALSWRRLRWTHSLWIVEPKTIMPELNLWQRFKLSRAPQCHLHYLGPIFPPPRELDVALPHHAQILARGYLLFNAGSGSQPLGDENAASLFYRTAKILSETQALPCIYVGSPPANHHDHDTLLALPAQTPKIFISLLAHCTLAVLSGGSGLLQAAALNRRIVGVAVAKDQYQRLAACQSHYGITIAESNVVSIHAAVNKALAQANENVTEIDSGLPQAIEQLVAILGIVKHD